MEPTRTTFGKYTVLANLPTPNTMLVQQAAAAGFTKLMVIRALADLQVQSSAAQTILTDAKQAAQLQHPNIQQIHEVGVFDNHAYIALEYLEGIRYDKLLRARKRDPALADPRLYCALLTQCCEGLHQGHRGINSVHGCLRPERVFLTSGGTVKVLDFGLHAAVEAQTPEELGQPEYYAYMSPEQVLGRSPDARSDVFSVGVLAWESLTGRRLFLRKSRVEVLRAITQKPIPPPDALEPSIPPALSQVVVRALAQDPSERFQSARELGVALEEGVGAPLSTVAIAATVDRFFSGELEQQRSVVLRARRELEGAADDDFEVPTQLFDGETELDFDAIPTARRSEPTAPPPPPAPNNRAFTRPPETLSDGDEAPLTQPPPQADLPGTERAPKSRGLLIVFLVLILAAAGGTAGYFYWLDTQRAGPVKAD